jgi:hypothetical protein
MWLKAPFSEYVKLWLMLPRSMLEHAKKEKKYNQRHKRGSTQGQTPCFDYSGNVGHVIVRWNRVNWPFNGHLRASKMHLFGLDLKFRMRAWKTHLPGITRVMHNYYNFHAQMESVAGPEKIPHRIPNCATKKKKIIK